VAEALAWAYSLDLRARTPGQRPASGATE
jgi:hypothetical protein